MHCFICMAYMVFICTAHPPKTPNDQAKPSLQEKRSLFHDVIESLRIRSQIPEDFNQNEDNNLSQNYDRYGYENEPQIPSDTEFIPRRNDRIEMPSLKYRHPKSLNNETSEVTTDLPKQEIILYIDTTKEPRTTTQKPKTKKRTRPPTNKNNKIQNKVQDEEVDEVDQRPEEQPPLTNTMLGQSQIGNRESQMVVKPTVIVNIRGQVTHRDSEIRIEGRTDNETDIMPEVPQNIFNINQEIKLERTFAGMGSSGGKKASNPVQDVSVEAEKIQPRIEEDMMMCETGTAGPDAARVRKGQNLFQIMFSLN